MRNLKMSMESGLSMGMCGIPWWNSDIGGFLSGDIESEYFRELIVRWFQFGVFCPVMRLHGSRLRPSWYKQRHPGVKEASGGENEIWSFGERNYPILKKLIEHKGQLLTYSVLLDALWEEGVQLLDKHALAVNINRLRKKIETQEHGYISNVYGMGYIWK